MKENSFQCLIFEFTYVEIWKQKYLDYVVVVRLTTSERVAILNNEIGLKYVILDSKRNLISVQQLFRNIELPTFSLTKSFYQMSYLSVTFTI